MNIIYCPCCKRPIAITIDLESLHTNCTICHYQYFVASGIVVGRHSWAQKSPANSNTGFCYEIRVEEKKNNKLNTFEFSLPGGEDKLLVFLNDSISLIYSIRKERSNELIEIHNYTTKKLTKVSHPGKQSQRAGSTVGLMLFPIILIGMTTVGISLPSAGVFSLISSSILGYSAALINSDKVKQTSVSKQNQSTAEQKLLLQFEALNKRLSELESQQKETIKLKTRLKNLAQNMQSTNIDLYTTRLKQMNKALSLIDRKRINTQALINKYRQCLNMFDIEILANKAGDMIPDNLIEDIIVQISEAQALDKQSDALKLQIAADEEIRGILSHDYN